MYERGRGSEREREVVVPLGNICRERTGAVHVPERAFSLRSKHSSRLSVAAIASGINPAEHHQLICVRIL